MKNLLRLVIVILMMGSAYAQPAGDWIIDNKTGCKVFNPNPKPNEKIDYVGRCVDGYADGAGVLTWFKDDIFGSKNEGTWKNGRLNGQGTMTFANGDKYVGEFKEGKASGQGTFTHANGSKYVGEFKDGKQNGQGTFTYSDGRKYVGELKDGKRNGLGTEYASNGSITNQGIWVDNKLVSSVPIQQATGPNQEVERLRAEALEVKRKQAEADGKGSPEITKEMSLLEEKNQITSIQNKNNFVNNALKELDTQRQLIQEVLSSYKLPLCKGDKEYWSDCHAKNFRDGQLLDEGQVLNGKREGKWIFYTRFRTGVLIGIPEIREFLNGVRIDGINAERNLQLMQKIQEKKEKFNINFSNMREKRLISECMSAGVPTKDCQERFKNKFEE